MHLKKYVTLCLLLKFVKMLYSIIIPVYNRPDEVRDLLASLTRQTHTPAFEVVVVEDGSVHDCRSVVEQFAHSLPIRYYYKANSGPGDSRNFGMRQAQGDYFLILDSDCILPADYLQKVDEALTRHYAHCFGGADGALVSFTPVQRAINFAMTSPLTTGGIRGSSERLGKFQPRSFNMGISRRAFEASGGFGRNRVGEDPDLSMRLWKLGFDTRLFANVVVFHKRRISWAKFYKQVHNFGKARPMLDSWHPQYRKPTFMFPSLFICGWVASLLLLLAGISWPVLLYAGYFLLCGAVATVQNRSLRIGLLSVFAIGIQFWAYGTGYLYSSWHITLRKRKAEEVLPNFFG